MGSPSEDCLLSKKKIIIVNCDLRFIQFPKESKMCILRCVYTAILLLGEVFRSDERPQSSVKVGENIVVQLVTFDD